jgi:hypothetical protein
MALVTIASHSTTASVISGDIMRPLVGVWSADLVIDQPDGSGFDPGSSVTITSENGYSLSGTIDPSRQGSFLDAIHIRVIGGAGGIVNKPATAKAYMQPGAFVRDVLNGLCNDSGEKLSSTIDPSFLANNLQAWSVLGGNTVGRSLRALLDIAAPTFNWRILADGTLWMGSETWSQDTTTYDILYQDPADSSFHIGSESPFISPGINLADVGNVSRVHDTIADGKMRSQVWIDIPGTDRGINDATQRIAKQAFPLVDYLGFYDAKVVSQSADGATVDIQPNDSRLAGMQRIPLRLGLPGCTVKFSPGAIVRLGWDRGNPELPYACLFNGGESITEIDIGSSPDNVVTKSDIDAIKAAISGAAVVAQDGGAALKANILAAWPVSVGSQSIKVQR